MSRNKPGLTPTPEADPPTAATPTSPQDQGPAEMWDVPTVDVGTPGFQRLGAPDDVDDPVAWAHGFEDGPPPGDGTVPGAAATETTGSPPASLSDGLVKLAMTVVGMATMLIHTLRTPGDNEVWQANADELVGMAGPLARIASRRVPKGIGGSSDLTDGLEAGFAATAYAIRNVEAERQWRAQSGMYVDTNSAEPPPSGEQPPEPGPSNGDPLSALRGARGA